MQQASCNPSCALPSFNMGGTSPKGMEDPGVIFQKFVQQATSNQFDSLMGLSTSPPVEDSIIIPCEFCGVQLEEEVLFHHQVRAPGGPVPVLPCRSSVSGLEDFRAEHVSLAFCWMHRFCELSYTVSQAFRLSLPSGIWNQHVTSRGPRSQDSIKQEWRTCQKGLGENFPEVMDTLCFWPSGLLLLRWLAFQETWDSSSGHALTIDLG